MNVDDIDKFGHCCVCHKNLMVKRVVDGKVADMFTPFYDETVFLLNNGSQMQVTICKTCKSANDLSDRKVHNNIMAAVMKGWELETDLLVKDESNPEWTKEKGEQYLDNMRKLSINCNSANLDKYTLQNKIIEIRNLKVEEVKSEIEVQDARN